MEELRYGGLRSPGIDAPFTNNAASNRDSNPFFTSIQPTNDSRGNLQRRFTTDSSKMALGRPFGQQQYTSLDATAVCDFHCQLFWLFCYCG